MGAKKEIDTKIFRYAIWDYSSCIMGIMYVFHQDFTWNYDIYKILTFVICSKVFDLSDINIFEFQNFFFMFDVGTIIEISKNFGNIFFNVK